MSWFNNGLNTLKGQITTFAQEVLAETERNEEEEVVNPFEALEECKKQNEELILQCSTKDAEIASLRKQISQLEKNASLEGSWICEPDNPLSEYSGKNDNERNSESSSGGDMITIPLDTNIPLSETGSWEKIHKSAEEKDQKLKKLFQENSNLKEKILQLTTDNQELTENLESLDSQHNIAIQELLELKNDLQSKFVILNSEYEILKEKHQQTIIEHQKDLENLKIKLEDRYEKEVDSLHETVKKLEEQSINLKKACEAKDEHIMQLLEKSNENDNDLKRKEAAFNEKMNELKDEIESLKEQLEKKQEEKSPNLSGSISKQGSEDEFIVLQDDGDGNENCEKRYKKMEEEKMKLEEKVSELENTISEIQLEKQKTNDELIKQSHSKDEMISSLQSEILKNSENITRLEKDVKNLKKANENLQKELGDQNEEISTQNKTIKDYEEKLKISKEKNQKLEVLIKTLEDLTKEKQELEEKFEFLQNEAKETANEHDIIELESHLNDMKKINENLKVEIEEQKLTISDLNETIVKCEANASDVESKLMMENVDLQKKIIDMESSNNEKQTSETITTIIPQDSINQNQIQNLLSTYFQITTNLSDLDGIENAFKSIQNEISQIDVLHKSIKQINDELSKLKSEKTAIEHEKKTLQADIMHYEEEVEELMKNNEILLNELENFKRNKLETISENDEEHIVKLEKQLEDLNTLNRTLENENKQFIKKIDEFEFERQEFQIKLQNLQDKNDNLERITKNLKQQIVAIEEENCRLIFEINEMKTDDKKSAMESEIHEFKTINQNLERQLERFDKDHSDLMATMQSQKAAFTEYKNESETSISNLEKQLKEKNLELAAKDNELQNLKSEIESLQSKVTVLTEQHNSLTQKLENSSNETQKLTTKLTIFKKNLKKLQTEKTALETKYEELKQNQDTPPSATNYSEMKISETEITELQKTIDTLTNEKNDLMQALTSKHNENIQYYSEIQRLDQLLKLEVEKSQKLSQNKIQECENCNRMQNEISDLKLKLNIDNEKLNDQIKFLKEKSDILTTNLLTEQTNQKLLQQEKIELCEQNTNLMKDLSRLRQHLVELEESHTQETIEMQNIIDETKAKMTELQKEVANSSNAFTSASIRANQHAETLQAQYALLSQQRDELLSKLSKAEDRESKNQAALVNLQCALEQFQKEKDKDIQLATNRIRKELKNEQDKQKQLQNEISSLNQQLSEANQGLLAATRLSNQLENSQMIINSLKEQITKLENANHSLEEKLHSTEINQADKIEKSLVKSLIIGYVVSMNQNDKIQILKMISSILNFDQIEINKVGLNRTQSGWFSNLLHGGTSDSNPSGDGLVKAFVDFLEKESQPRNNSLTMPNLLNIVSSSSSSESSSRDNNNPIGTATTTTTTETTNLRNERKISTDRLSTSSTQSTNSYSHHVQPILVNESVLEQFAPTRNSSSILKDILNDT